MKFLHSDFFLKFASVILIPTALAVKTFAADHTIAYQVADYVLGAGAALGIYSTTGRAPYTSALNSGKTQGM